MTRSIRRRSHGVCYFADDIVMIDETRRVNARIQEVVTSMRCHTSRWGCLDEMEACLRVLCDKKIHLDLKCWRYQERTCPKMHVAEMRMLRWMCGHTRAIRLGTRLSGRSGSGLSWWTRGKQD
ncbi:hypothetical protein H5410_016224 [Solanum commersonii]|uniref:Reverse transcriptase domain-containing protein n=1 Tax=Solanum commersonii TaxID=4109 RepID=A0A9J5ZVZ9_SOLCO|nr:hypothetical protein H5410_016224 [Solanum commersonii]